MKKISLTKMPSNLLLSALLGLILINCDGSKSQKEPVDEDFDPTLEAIVPELDTFLRIDTIESISKGTVSNGSLINGVILPLKGKNFAYFSLISYQACRAYVHSSVRRVILDSYRELEKTLPDRFFYLMESANKNGGALPPHQTHQNGLSVDFMALMLKNDEPFLDLDKKDILHYDLEFDEKGQWLEDKNVVIDFETMALHIQSLEKACKKHNMKIAKIILKINVKDELFASPTGRKLKHLPFVTGLPERVDKQHDDHYHIDFELLN